MLKLLALVVLLLLLLFSGYLAYLAHSAPPPEARLVAGVLRPCPATPNCVSSESGDPAARIEPLRFTGSPERAWADLQAAIQQAGGSIVEMRDGFLWATFTSRIFRFVDDVECRLVAEEGVIQLRSGSRVGRSDLGVNAARVEQLRVLFAQRQGRG